MGVVMEVGEAEGHDAQPPVLDGKYRVLAQLGQGGTANVLLAVARGPSGFSKLVVLKSMKSTLRNEPDLPRMFMNEARLAARLNHPNIVQTNEVFEAAGLPTIVMEHLEGQTLASVTTRACSSQRFPLPMRLRVISQVLAGLHCAHELTDFDGTPLSVVHRDVSPHNVFVTFEGQVKLLDFGIAKCSGSNVETATGVLKGKLRYMSPEQIAGEGIDRRSDVFAVGIMLWEAATDSAMWSGLHDATIMNRILNGEIPTPRAVNTEIDAELEAIVMKALALEKQDRYPTAEALQQTIDDYLESLGAHVRDREIGDAVAALFGDERNKTRQWIDAQLAHIGSLSSDEYASADPLDLRKPSDTVSGSRNRLAVSDPAKQPKLSWVALVAAIGALAIAGFSSWREIAQAPARAAPTNERAPIARTAMLRVTAFPASAELSLDAERLPGNPYARSYPLERGVQHTLLARAPGHRDAQRSITIDQDLDVVLMLEALPPAPIVQTAQTASLPRPAKSQTARAQAVTPALPRATLHVPAVLCDPPYSIDSRGVKKFKPECL